MVFNRSIERLTQTKTMNWFLKTFISLISLVHSGMWKRPEVDQTHEKSPKTNDTRNRGGTLRLMVVHYLAPGRVFGPETCERVWRLQMSCLHLWYQQLKKKHKQKTIVTWYWFAKLPNCACKTVRASSPGRSDGGAELAGRLILRLLWYHISSKNSRRRLFHF